MLTAIFTKAPDVALEQVATPTASPSGGTFTSSRSVELSCKTKNAVIMYRIDASGSGGGQSDAFSEYTKPINLTNTATIRAYAVKEGMTDSEVISVKFTRRSSDNNQYGSTGNYPGYTFPTLTNPPDSSNSSDFSQEWQNPFTDVNNDDWFYDDVKYAIENGLFNGTSEEIFDPEASITRGMFVTVLWRLNEAFGIEDIGSDWSAHHRFLDVPDRMWYTEAVRWAAAYEIINGTSSNSFDPYAEITREQIVAILYRYQQYSGKIPPDVVMDREFADWDDINEWAKIAVNTLTTQGIISGKPDGLFDPQGTATRAEVAALSRRYLSK